MELIGGVIAAAGFIVLLAALWRLVSFRNTGSQGLLRNLPADGVHGLLALDGVEMTDSHRPAVVRAELLARLGRAAEARAAYEEAISRCRNETELAHLRQRLAAV